MTLSLLLDEQISREIAIQVGLKRPDIPIASMYTWRNGRYTATRDDLILEAAATEGLTLVTYDQKSIMPVLVLRGQLGLMHAGVIFIDELTVGSSDFGGLVRSLIAQWDISNALSWTNAILYLNPSR